MSDATGLRLSKTVKGLGPFDLDKAGFELWQGLDALGLPGLRLIHGDDGEISAADVKTFAPRLAKLTFAQFWKAFRTTDVGRDADADVKAFLAEYFPVLQSAYAAAAKAKCGLVAE